jgi:osmotically inducible protein OsmC
MPERTATAVWQGPVPEGKGEISLGSGMFDAAYSFGSRFESDPGTNPEELLGAAHAGCFTMALALGLSQAGHPPTRIDTEARVAITKVPEGFRIPYVELRTRATVPGISQETFQQEAERAKTGCPVSLALAGTDIRLSAELVG